MTQLLFREDAYQSEASGTVLAVTDRGGIVLDQTVFYPTSGGQTGDSGTMEFDGQTIEIATTVKGDSAQVVLVPAADSALPTIGAAVHQRLNWQARHRMMRMHTALHLLSVVIPLPVTGGQITPEKGRLDFDMPDAPENRDALAAQLNALVTAGHPVTESWITEAELDANPGLVKTMTVQPPRGSGRVRLVRIGDSGTQIDLQPCGGTHVRSTAEIGALRIGKIEKKGRQNRRVSLFLDDP